MSTRVLVVDDNEDICLVVVTLLRKAGYTVESHNTGAAALESLKSGHWDIVVTDLRMPKMDGIQLLTEIKNLKLDTSVIVITAHGTIDTAVEAMRLGAADFILKPFDVEQLELRVERVQEARSLRREVATLKKQLGATAGGQIIANSPGMQLVLERARKVAASDAAVLITGESGTGKECIANFLFRESPQWNKSLVARNCAAVPETVFESEMFGHKKGSFTGADRDRKGAFVEAEGGTLFLDEIGDLTYSLQTKLLRAVQERIVHPVGGDKDVPVNFRLVCATNKNLLESCKNKEFREDLYYRIATVTLHVPPLRERPEDILPLARYFVRLLSSNTRTFSPRAEDALQNYAWPGNVRELRSIVEQSIIFSARNEIDPDELNLPSHTRTESVAEAPSLTLEDAERRHILHVLQSVNGNKTEAAKVLNLARSTLVLKLKAYGVKEG